MCGALRETRTPDPLITNQTLYRLSYEGSRGTIAVAGAADNRARSASNPTLDQLRALRLDGMAQAFAELQTPDGVDDLPTPTGSPC